MRSNWWIGAMLVSMCGVALFAYAKSNVSFGARHNIFEMWKEKNPETSFYLAIWDCWRLDWLSPQNADWAYQLLHHQYKLLFQFISAHFCVRLPTFVFLLLNVFKSIAFLCGIKQYGAKLAVYINDLSHQNKCLHFLDLFMNSRIA